MLIITVMITSYLFCFIKKWKQHLRTLNCYNYRSGQFDDMFALSKHPDIFVQYYKCSLYQQIVGGVNKRLRCTFFLLFFISFMFSWLDTFPGFGSIGLWDIRYGSVDVLDWLCKKHRERLLRKCHGKECCTNSNITKRRTFFTWSDICVYFLQGNTVVVQDQKRDLMKR